MIYLLSLFTVICIVVRRQKRAEHTDCGEGFIVNELFFFCVCDRIGNSSYH